MNHNPLDTSDTIPRKAFHEKIERIKELERVLENIRLMAEEDIRTGSEGVHTYQIEAEARAALRWMEMKHEHKKVSQE